MAVVTTPGNAWINLANAIAIQAVLDYEYLVSDKPAFIAKDKVSKEEIRLFANKQTIVNSDINAILDRIDRVYEKKFRPYVAENYKSIIEYTKKAKKRKNSWTWLQDNSPHRCPLCDGALRQGAVRDGSSDYIVCTHCNLNMLIPKEKK